MQHLPPCRAAGDGPDLPLTLGGLLQFSEREGPCPDHRLDLPATHGALGCVLQDPAGAAAAEVCVAAGHKAGVGSVVEADGTLLSFCGWEGNSVGQAHWGQGWAAYSRYSHRTENQASYWEKATS